MTSTLAPRLYLADRWPRTAARDTALVLSGTLLITLSALMTIPLPFTPVPIALSTFTVFFVGAALGSLRGMLSSLLYLLLGAAGAPVFSYGQSGVAFPTFGYIVGFVVAAAVVGRLAGQGAGRKVMSTLLLASVGTVILYVCGVPWLALSLGVDLGMAVMLGVVPFVIGDAIKILALSAVLPGAWKLLAMLEDHHRGTK